MTAELIETGSEMTAVARDVTDDVKLVARDSAEMKAAQSQLANWFRGKLEITQRDLAEMSECVQLGEEARMDTRPLKRQQGNIRRRSEFYNKCMIASEAGYCVVPGMHADVFAIRTKRDRPAKRNERDYPEAAARDQLTERLPAGEGDYRDSEPVVSSREAHLKDKQTGEFNPVTLYFADELADVEFPISVAKPEVMTQAVHAMALKVFDRLEIIPGRRVKGDPIVLGVIRHPMTGPWDRTRDMHFLIAWFLDTATLT